MSLRYECIIHVGVGVRGYLDVGAKSPFEGAAADEQHLRPSRSCIATLCSFMYSGCNCS